MIPYERQKRILEILNQNDVVKIDDLLKIFPEISPSTLRRDLKELENKRKIETLAGGGVKKISTMSEIPISHRSEHFSDEKEKIAKIAADLVQDGDVIYLDSGSSCTSLFRELLGKKITIYTTNLGIFKYTDGFAGEIIVLGGRFNPMNHSLTGPYTESMLNELYFNKSFLGINSIDEKLGAMTPSIEEAIKKRLVKDHSDTTYLLCDSSKFHKFSNILAFPLQDVLVISNSGDPRLEEVVEIIS